MDYRNQSNNERKVFYLEKNRIKDFQNRCLVALFVNNHDEIEFIEYVEEGHFIGNYSKKKKQFKEQHIYIFNKPKIFDSKNSIVFVSKVQKRSLNIHYEEFSQKFMTEYSVFRSNVYDYIKRNFFDWVKALKNKNLFDSKEPSNINKLYKYKLAPDKVLNKMLVSENNSDLDELVKRYKEFVGGSLTFTNPVKFNDPFDCDCNLELLNEKSLANYLYTAFTATKYKNIGASIYKIKKKTINKVIKETESPLKNIELVIEECVKQYLISKKRRQRKTKIEDLKESVLNNFISLNKGKRTIKEDLRILCMAKKPDDILMWGYYTDGGKGICGEYQLSDIINSINTQKNDVICIYGNVDYINERSYTPNYKQKSTDTADNLFEFVIKRIFTKYEGWKHENEFRIALIDCDKQMKDWESINTNINGIYYGVKANDIYTFSSESKIPLRKQMVKAIGKFKLEIK